MTLRMSMAGYGSRQHSTPRLRCPAKARTILRALQRENQTEGTGFEPATLLGHLMSSQTPRFKNTEAESIFQEVYTRMYKRHHMEPASRLWSRSGRVANATRKTPRSLA